MTLIIVIVAALASARVWRVLLLDDIGFRFRDWANQHAKLWEFFNCPWCFGFWISAAFILIGVVFPGWVFLLIAGPFAANYISANLNVHTGDKQ